MRIQENQTTRWLTRIWSILSIFYLLWNDVHDDRGVFTQSTAVLGATGLALGWFIPLPGGVIALLALLLRLIVNINAVYNFVAPPEFLEIHRFGSVISIIFNIIVFMPGVLFLWGWLSGRKLKQENKTQNPDSPLGK